MGTSSSSPRWLASLWPTAFHPRSTGCSLQSRDAPGRGLPFTALTFSTALSPALVPLNSLWRERQMMSLSTAWWRRPSLALNDNGLFQCHQSWNNASSKAGLSSPGALSRIQSRSYSLWLQISRLLISHGNDGPLWSIAQRIPTLCTNVCASYWPGGDIPLRWRSLSQEGIKIRLSRLQRILPPQKDVARGRIGPVRPSEDAKERESRWKGKERRGKGKKDRHRLFKSTAFSCHSNSSGVLHLDLHWSAILLRLWTRMVLTRLPLPREVNPSPFDWGYWPHLVQNGRSGRYRFAGTAFC